MQHLRRYITWKGFAEVSKNLARYSSENNFVKIKIIIKMIT